VPKIIESFLNLSKLGLRPKYCRSFFGRRCIVYPAWSLHSVFIVLLAVDYDLISIIIIRPIIQRVAVLSVSRFDRLKAAWLGAGR